MKTYDANAICLTCGTAQADDTNGFCENGHDNWLEDGDEGEMFIEAMSKFEVDMVTLKNAIKNSISLSKVNTTPKQETSNGNES